MCTGIFVEPSGSDINGQQRPPPGTRCVNGCKQESGRWGASFCYTEEDESQWGAECVPCAGLFSHIELERISG